MEVRRKSECDQNLRDLVRNDVRNLGGDDIKLVMIYFIGFQANVSYYKYAVFCTPGYINICCVIEKLIIEFFHKSGDTVQTPPGPSPESAPLIIYNYL